MIHSLIIYIPESLRTSNSRVLDADRIISDLIQNICSLLWILSSDREGVNFHIIHPRITSNFKFSGPWFTQNIKWSALKISLFFQLYTFRNHLEFPVLGSLIHPEYAVIYFENYHSLFNHIHVPESLRISSSRVPDSPRISSDLLWKCHSFFNHICSRITWNFKFSGP